MLGASAAAADGAGALGILGRQWIRGTLGLCRGEAAEVRVDGPAVEHIVFGTLGSARASGIRTNIT